MSDKNLTGEVKRLNATISAVEIQRNEALTARAHAQATVTLLQETLREMVEKLNAANGELAELKRKAADAEPKDEKPAKKVKNAA